MATEYTQQGFGRSPDYYAGVSTAERPRRPTRYTREPARKLTGPLDPHGLARGLGWFSVALGLAELAAPRGVGFVSGVGQWPLTLRGAGVRELAAGVGILTQRNPAPWVWSRVAGDVMDLALLLTGLRPSNPARGRAVTSLALVAGITAVDVLTALQLSQEAGQPRALRSTGRLFGRTVTQADVYIDKSIVINKSPDECYKYWRNIENLPRFMRHVESIRRIDERRSHWIAKGPAASRLEWDSEITEDRPGEALSWRTLDGADVANAGSVRFEAAPGGRGTIVRVSMHFSPAGGRVGARLAKLLGDDPQSKVKEDLRRFKQVLETGEIPTTRGQPVGRRSLFARVTREWRLA